MGIERSSPSPEFAHSRTVLLVMFVHAPMRLSLLWHSVIDASLPSQSTAAKATGRFLNRTCTVLGHVMRQHLVSNIQHWQ